MLSISINPDKSLVSIKGKVDVDLLLETISKLGKRAEIVYYNKNPNNDEYTHAGEFKHGQNIQERYQTRNNQQNGHERNGFKIEDKKKIINVNLYTPAL